MVAIDSGNLTGELHAKLPTISQSTSTDLYIYYGNTGVIEVNTNNAAWQNYRGVWYLQVSAGAVDTYGLGIAGQLAMDGGDGSGANFYGPNPISTTMLKPWRLSRGTGYKYKTTNKFLNELYGCSTEDIQLENGVTVSY